MFSGFSCPDAGYTWNSSCYVLSEFRASHEDADDYCEARGMKLVSVNSRAENAIVKWLMEDAIAKSELKYCLNNNNNNNIFICNMLACYKNIILILKYISEDSNSNHKMRTYLTLSGECREAAVWQLYEFNSRFR